MAPVRIALGFVTACGISGLVLGAGLVGAGGGGWLLGISLVTALQAGGFSLVPAAIVIGLTESRGWRSVLPWLALGGSIGLAGYLVTSTFGGHGDRLPAFLAAGFAAGGTYWLISGRLAGAD